MNAKYLNKLRGLIYSVITADKKNFLKLSIGPDCSISTKGVFFRGSNSIGARCRIQFVDSVVRGGAGIVLGYGSCIQQHAHITCASSIIIGEFTALTANVTITDITHPYDDILISPMLSSAKSSFVKIGNNCLICNNVVILPGVILGNHNVVAANSVVTNITTDDYCVLAGNPARVIKKFNIESGIWEKVGAIE